jgi:hypothetical protein
MEGNVKRRRGRPASGQARHENLTIRIRSDLREALQRQADLNGRSVSAELETQIEQALGADNLLLQVYDLEYGRQLGAFVRLLALVTKEVSIRANLRRPVAMPLSDPWVYAQIEKAIGRVLAALRPLEPAEVPAEIQDMERRMPGIAKASAQVGETLAVQTLMAVAGVEGEEWLKDRAQPIRDRLGEAIVQRLSLEAGVTRAPDSKRANSSKE